MTWALNSPSLTETISTNIEEHCIILAPLENICYHTHVQFLSAFPAVFNNFILLCNIILSIHFCLRRSRIWKMDQLSWLIHFCIWIFKPLCIPMNIKQQEQHHWRNTTPYWPRGLLSGHNSIHVNFSSNFAQRRKCYSYK